MEDKVIILSVTTYDFTDDKTGKQITGGKVNCINRITSETDKVGYLPFTLKVERNYANGLKAHVPCSATVKYELVPGSNGRVQMVVDSISPSEKVDFSSFIE